MTLGGEKMDHKKNSKSEKSRIKDPSRWRDLTAYWILGLCNNYGYVVMLSAAHDIIGRFSGEEVRINSNNINIIYISSDSRKSVQLLNI